MQSNAKRSIALLLALVIGVFGCMFTAHLIQTDFGNVEISQGIIAVDDGTLSYKLYVPKSADADHPAPGVLLLHGYQNDSETCAAYAIELARRGVVVMSLDEYGHGDTSVGLLKRGYVNHKVSVNYGEDSEISGTYSTAGGPARFRLMMN